MFKNHSLRSCMNQLPFLLHNLTIETEYYLLLPFHPPISKAALNVFILIALHMLSFLFCFFILVILPL